jgi:PAS domain S-box-containing protein
VKIAKILNVSDHKINRDVRTQNLRNAGYTVIEAATGAEALAQAASEEPQLVLLDMDLPDIHGAQVCRLIKARINAKPALVVPISATQTSVHDRVIGLENGADSYLVEPVDPELLLATVRSMLRLWHVESELEESLAATRNLAARHQSLIEAVPHVIFTATAEGHWTYVSERFVTHTRLPEEEALGACWMDLLHPLDRGRTLELWSHSLGSGDLFEAECRLRRLDGSYCWNIIRARAVRHDGGSVVQWVGSATDIHARKMLEEEVRLRHHEFVALAEHSPDIIARLDPGLRYSYVNKAVGRVSSRTPEEHIGKTHRELGYEEAFCECFEEACSQVLASGQTNTFEYSHEAEKGSKRYSHGRIIPEFAKDGSIQSLLSITTDVTDRKNAAKAVTDSERKLRHVVESNVIGVVIVDGEDITFANDLFLKTIGYTREDLQSGILKWGALTPAEYLEMDEKCMEELREKGTCTTFEKEYWRKDGSRVPIFLGAAALKKDASEYCCFIVDMSGLKNAEAALKKTNLSLKRSNEDLEQFAYAASHDLQEPLRTVSIYTQLLIRKQGPELSPESVKFIGIIQEAADRMLKLINDLLAFSHVQSAELSFREATPVADMIGEAKKNLKRAIEESGAVVSFAELPAISVDAAQLTLVFQNLIGNSIKYRKPDETPKIKITAERQGENWLFCVRDNGSGFEQEHAERIFGYFKRLHGRDIPGTGIGLAIVKRIIERHGGHVWVESQPGNGASFFFRLPIGGSG